jgi:eukaryotic-like serine/threonine-protein kinase
MASMSQLTKQKSYCPECGEAYDARVTVCPRDGTTLFAYRLRDTEPMDPLVGEVLDGRFRLEAMLGQGGMGAVYRGVQLSVDRKVAIKVLKPDLANEEVIIQRFFREARVISELAHPGIVNLIDFGQDASRDVLYLVMELVDGWELGSLLRRGRLHLDAALDAVSQVCSALSEPHARGIVHRDLKPDNMMLVPLADGSVRVKVLDFGIASALQLDTKITSTGMICGTAHYMAPEQAQARDIGAATDIYSLGVVLYELLCGQLPFEADSALQILLKHVQVTPPSLREYVSADEVPDRVVALVDQMLAKSPADRPPSVVAIRDEIEAIMRAYDLRPMRVDTSVSRAQMLDVLLVSGGGRRVVATSEQMRLGTQETDHGMHKPRDTAEAALLPTYPSAPAVEAAVVPVEVAAVPTAPEPVAPAVVEGSAAGRLSPTQILVGLIGLVLLLGTVVVLLVSGSSVDSMPPGDETLGQIRPGVVEEPASATETSEVEEAVEAAPVEAEPVAVVEIEPEVEAEPVVAVEPATVKEPSPAMAAPTVRRPRRVAEHDPAPRTKPEPPKEPSGSGTLTIFGLE